MEMLFQIIYNQDIFYWNLSVDSKSATLWAADLEMVLDNYQSKKRQISY
jgi:hypothetical protein